MHTISARVHYTDFSDIQTSRTKKRSIFNATVGPGNSILLSVHDCELAFTMNNLNGEITRKNESNSYPSDSPTNVYVLCTSNIICEMSPLQLRPMQHETAYMKRNNSDETPNAIMHMLCGY